MTEGKVAFCFPGQGSQEVGMGRAMSEAYPAARAVYDRAAEAAGFDVAALCFEGPIERLSETDVTQPALVSTELACLAGLTAAGMRPDYVVGHSVGEYAALAAAGSIDDRTAAHLTRERGLATAAAAAATPGAMAAVIGLDDAEVERVCGGIEGVWAANFNCPGQVVVSGTRDGVAALMAAAEKAGARRAIMLKVSGGFHSPLTASAEPRLAADETICQHLECSPCSGLLPNAAGRPASFSSCARPTCAPRRRPTTSFRRPRHRTIACATRRPPGRVS